ncbi:hypothetical protein ACQ661_11830, partial [Pseudidiomarina sp. WS423]|uniref:hypothetical protein n=1 Tax=Pseudidiomarina sp. WS423 TaxID=3425124 RepID=UPI003D6EB688
YTLVESPRSFYINLAKTVGFSLAFLYLAIGGVVPKKSDDKSKWLLNPKPCLARQNSDVADGDFVANAECLS